MCRCHKIRCRLYSARVTWSGVERAEWRRLQPPALLLPSSTAALCTASTASDAQHELRSACRLAPADFQARIDVFLSTDTDANSDDKSNPPPPTHAEPSRRNAKPANHPKPRTPPPMANTQAKRMISTLRKSGVRSGSTNYSALSNSASATHTHATYWEHSDILFAPQPTSARRPPRSPYAPRRPPRLAPAYATTTHRRRRMLPPPPPQA